MSARLLALGFTLFAALLTGCEGQKIVARVNTEPIREDEFYKRVERVSPNELQGGNFDAGAATLISMIVEKLNAQSAAQKNLRPSDEAVNRMVAYLKKSNPQLRSALKSGRFSDEDLVRRVRSLMLDFALGTNGAQADAAKLETLYKQRVPSLTIPESWVVQILPVQDEAAGMRALEELKKTGDFQAAARVMGIPPQVAVTAGQETSLPVKNVDAATKAVLDKIAPGTFADKPVKLTVVNPSQTLTVLLKMIGKEAEYVPKLDDVKFILTQEIVSQDQPQWQQFKNQQLAEATRKADIQINIERYRYLRDVIRSQAEQNAQAPVPMGSVPPTGGGSPPPPSGGGSSAAPPSGGGTKPPSGGTPPSTSGTKAPGTTP
jgi:hypothetical protein